jgi:hypothetical protein
MNINPKVQAAGWAGAASIVLVWGASLAGLEVPPEVASAITVLLATAAGYIKSA